MLCSAFSVFQETFYEDRELYSPLLTPADGEVVTTDYQRVVDESEEVQIQLVGAVITGVSSMSCYCYYIVFNGLLHTIV